MSDYIEHHHTNPNGETVREASVMRCQLEIVFSPARPDLADIGPLHDPGGFVYRVRGDDGRVCLAGSVRTLDPLVAIVRAKQFAKRAGFTEWRGWNAGGPYHAIREMSRAATDAGWLPADAGVRLSCVREG